MAEKWSQQLPPDDQWAQDMSATYARNAKYALSHPSYQTRLSSREDMMFRQWLAEHRVPFNPDDPIADYDMRGYWKDVARGGGDRTSVNENDGRLHFPDTYKTPYHHSFSSESIYARPSAPSWINDYQLADENGDVVWDERYMGRQPEVEVSSLKTARKR